MKTNKTPISNQLPRLDKAVSEDDTRYELKCIHINGNFATATDAEILVRYDVSNLFNSATLAALNGKLIPGKVWAKMCKVEADSIKCEDNYISFDWHVEEDCYTYQMKFDISLSQEYKQRDFTKVMDALFESNIPIDNISINPNLLNRIHEIICPDDTQGATLLFHGKTKQIGIIYSGNTNAIAILMPCITHEGDVDINRFNHLK